MDEIGWKLTDSAAASYKLNTELNLTEGEQALYTALTEKYLGENLKNTKEVLPATIQRLHELLKEVCSERKVLLRMERAVAIEKNASMSLAGNGIFDLLLADDSLEEISAIGENSPIRVYKRKEGWLETNCAVASKAYAIELINKMARHIGRRITLRSPTLNASLPDGSRLHATISPVNANGFEITIRKFPKNPIKICDLMENGTISPDAAGFLWICSLTDASILFCGNTGSGKTTLLNSILSFLPQDERVILIEETPEIAIPHAHKIKLVCNESLGIGMAELVHNSLRMRPDRVVVSEVRTKAEVLALFESLQAGQAKGCYATFHSQNSAEAVHRLAGFGIPKADLSCIDLIAVIRRISVYDSRQKERREIRRVMEISEIDANGNTRALFAYDALTGKLAANMPNLEKGRIKGRIDLNFNFSGKSLLSEARRRGKILEKLVGTKLEQAEFLSILGKEMFQIT